MRTAHIAAAVIAVLAIIVVAVYAAHKTPPLLKSTSTMSSDGLPGGWESRMVVREGMMNTDRSQFRAIGMGSGNRDPMFGTIKFTLTGELLGNTGETTADIAVAWSTKSGRPSRGTGLEIPRYPGLELIKVVTLPIRSDKTTPFHYEAKIHDLPGASYWFDVAVKTKEPQILMFQNVVLRIWGG